MIKIKCDMNGMQIFAYGHAGFARKGKDIVCAAASTLIFTLINSVPCIYDDEGDLYIKVLREKDRNVFETIVKGLGLLSVSYPDNISIGSVPYRNKNENDKIKSESHTKVQKG